MRIGIPVRNGQVFGHFGQAKTFLLVDIVEGQATAQTLLDATQTGGHSANVSFLAEQGVTHVIAGGMGDGARDRFTQLGIPVFIGAQGDPVEAALALAAGKLEPGDSTGCNCGGHEHHHHHG